MDQNSQNSAQAAQPEEEIRLQGGTYEIIRARLQEHGRDLLTRLSKLNDARKEVFGAVETKLLSSERITTDNNCVPRDMVPLGDKFIFGYNVFVGLRSETTLSDVFAVYQWKDGTFVPDSIDLIVDERFEADFKNLYKYYRYTRFAKFAVIRNNLFMVFRVGRGVSDVKTFKWRIRGHRVVYLDNRSDHEYVFPAQHEFEWRRVTQDMHRTGKHPHVSIEDRVFVETIGGDLTVKIEDNTETGEGIYSEPVDDPDQTLNDAEIHYAIVGSVILMKIRPYQEERFRHILYNEKIKKAVRLDAIKDACVLLPEDHGLIFPKGYYLQTGVQKQFETQMEDMVFERRMSSPNGEDHLFVFYNRDSGVYTLLSYNMIEQKVNTPIICNGYSFFEDGKLIYFRASEEARKHHVIQVWQTPYYSPDFSIPVKTYSELYKIGNKDIVRCMAECHEVINLIGQDEAYANLYLDIAKKAEETKDSYFWIDSADTFKLSEPLTQIKLAADAALAEFEKVVATKRNTRAQIEGCAQDIRQTIDGIDYEQLDDINEFVQHLSKLRAIRGELTSLRDLRYADLEMIESFETEVAEHADKLSSLCVEFLLKEEALQPYRQKVQQLGQEVPGLLKAADAKELKGRVEETSGDLEMLTDIVSNLKIADATETIVIIDNISLVYSQVNQVRSALKNKLNELGRIEGQAEFGSQVKLIDQSAINYLDICDTPEKCDEYLTKIGVQLENLESRFADFEDFVVQLAEKREELYNAFESRKVQLVARRNQRASALMKSAERILKGISNRANSLTDINEINGYFASDLMIERIRETIQQLTDLGDSVKAEDLKGQLKTIHQDAVRQLKDKQALYEEGENLIRLGNHRFAVNRQPLEATIVRQDSGMFFHLTGTGFFEAIEDELLDQTRDVWQLEVLSEAPDVYRGEYLAYRMLREIENSPEQLKALASAKLPDVVLRVQQYMGPRYGEGYVKGVHDRDGAKILQGLVGLRNRIGLLRYSTQARALAVTFWALAEGQQEKQLLAARIAGIGRANRLFGPGDVQQAYIEEAREQLEAFIKDSQLFSAELLDEAAEYLFWDLAGDAKFTVAKHAVDLRNKYESYLRQKRSAERFSESIEALSGTPVCRYRLVRDWVRSYLLQSRGESELPYCDEVASLFLSGGDSRRVCAESIECELAGMVGSHKMIDQGKYLLNYCRFMSRLRNHERTVVPQFTQYQKRKGELIERFSGELHLEQFRPRVLTTFVRNKLIDRTYLPLVGDNLAKQVGAEGEQKRTDRQGLLLLISPPGYGKTTLMEYIANRLGLIFMKINAPALGNKVTSLDPAEAANAAAREELRKLNLAFEMGDNIMVYIDDIQHSNPEFLQKFISLCDAQRKVEGIYGGRSRTYDLRGKRVCVVMAGNPYTESGQKFRIPDMLANRADVYNIGDIVGNNYEQFVDSYIENCLTSNPVLEKLARRSQSDVYSIMKIAETGREEGIEFEGNYSVEEIKEYVLTMKKLYTVREVVLKVNQEYIRSAAQADEYRTEPPFLLQGSYRNMNRIAARVLPVMNDEELWTLIYSAYEQDAQTLTTGAESNLLKFRELTGRLSGEQAERWEDIRKTFRRNLFLGGDSEDNVGKIIRQLNAFSAGLDSIRDVIAGGLDAFGKRRDAEPEQATSDQIKAIGQEVLDRMAQLIAEVKQGRDIEVRQSQAEAAEKTQKDTQALVSVLEEQFKAMETWLLPMAHGDKKAKEKVVKELMRRFETMVEGYNRLIEVLKNKYETAKSPGTVSETPGEDARSRPLKRKKRGEGSACPDKD